jgi:hypothetical protein
MAGGNRFKGDCRALYNEDVQQLFPRIPSRILGTPETGAFVRSPLASETTYDFSYIVNSHTLDSHSRGAAIILARRPRGVCPYRKFDPGVLTMEPTENIDRGDSSDALNGSPKRRVLVSRKTCPRGVAVGQIGFEGSAKTSFSDNHDVIETINSVIIDATIVRAQQQSGGGKGRPRLRRSVARAAARQRKSTSPSTPSAIRCASSLRPTKATLTVLRIVGNFLPTAFSTARRKA